MKKLMVMAAMGLMFAGSAMAQGYVGGSLGRSMTTFDGTDFEPFPGETHSFEKNKTAYKLFAGYNFNKNFAIEGGYADLGKPAQNVAWVGGSGKGVQKESAWFVAGKGTLPINEQFNLFGKLGLTQNKVKASWSDTDGFSGSDSKSRSGVLYGVGAEYNVSKQIGVRMEYEDFGKFGSQFVNDTGTGRTKTSLWSVGMAYKF